MFDIKNKSIAVLGCQRTGQSLARLIVAKGGNVRISDVGSKDQVDAQWLDWARQNNVVLEFDGHSFDFLQEADILVISPGITPKNKYLKFFLEQGKLCLGEIEFASQFISVPIIGVTGSNGKTTVSTLIHEVLEAAGKKSCLCGNIGYPLSEAVLDVNKDSGFEYCVVELSSFQLESFLSNSDSQFGVKGFQPKIGVLLNFSENHLDRHKDLEEYFQAKSRIFLNQSSEDFAVLNKSDEKVMSLNPEIKASVCCFNSAEDVAKSINPNLSAVRAVAEILEIFSSCVDQVWNGFKGVEHRLEKVMSIDGVNYINDSKSTTVQAGVWALTRSSKDVVLICGGRDKNLDFSPVQSLLQSKVKAVIVFGECQEKIKDCFDGIVNVISASSLEAAVQTAKKEAVAGSEVVFSPMCASFDMFKDYEDRGRAFKAIVQNCVSEKASL